MPASSPARAARHSWLDDLAERRLDLLVDQVGIGCFAFLRLLENIDQRPAQHAVVGAVYVRALEIAELKFGRGLGTAPIPHPDKSRSLPSIGVDPFALAVVVAASSSAIQ